MYSPRSAGILAVVLFLALAVFASLPPGDAQAQNFGGAFEGMRDQKEPVEIEADRLEVVDKKGVAIFEGNVSVTQGSTLLKTRKLTVYYVGGADGKKGPAGNVRRIEASGKVAVRSNDQLASADNAVVDMQKQEALLSGDVTISQGDNVIKGCKLSIDLATNYAKLEPCQNASKSGRVIMMINPKSNGSQ
jgi:lipopolysaccharide export system protein LptA